MGSNPAARTSLRSRQSESEGCRAEVKRRRAAHVHRRELRLGKPVAEVRAMQFSYVYILQSESHSDCFHVGLTDNLHARLQKHNSGGVPHTSKFRPWHIKTAVAFSDRERAAEFERHLNPTSATGVAI